MLAFLKVKGFAIIDEIEMEFGDGFNVITGETGAGKSILMNALSTLMNVKASPEVVRSNAQQAEIMGHFLYKGKEYILKRIISSTGRSRAFLNNEPIPLARLDELGGMLVNIYGQNEFQYLLSKESYVEIIDNLLGLNEKRALLSEKVVQLKKIGALLEGKSKELEEREKEIALLEFQIDEIERANLKDGEEEALKERLRMLKDAEKIKTTLMTITEGIYEGENSIHLHLKRSMNLLKPFSRIEALENLRKKLELLIYDVEEIQTIIRDIEKGLMYDGDELERVEGRLSRIYELKSKYGNSCEEITRFQENGKKRLDYLKGLSTDIEVLKEQYSVLEGEVNDLADKLSDLRKKGAGKIEKAIINELSFLAMKGLKFSIMITHKGSIDENGRDDIDMMISTNPGEPMKPLRKIASGGELSRIMLAIKKVIGGEEEKTLIFDEVDAGIGGRIADMVGKRLKDLAAHNQVICITHLPQIAVYGDHHFLVEKYFEKHSTHTNVKKLTKEQRVAEIARMLGGEIITKKTFLRAEEMLTYAKKSIH